LKELNIEGFKLVLSVLEWICSRQEKTICIRSSSYCTKVYTRRRVFFRYSSFRFHKSSKLE